MTELPDQAKRALTATVHHWRDADLEEWEVLERGRRGHLELLLEPQSEAELAALVAALRAHHIPTTTIAGQSGLVEAQRPHGVAIAMTRFDALGPLVLADGTRLSTEDLAALDAPLPLERRRGARLHTGAGTPIDRINAALAPAGLKLPIVMGSTATASAGACAANGSAGANALRYGTAADLAVHVRGVLGTGEVVAQDVPRRPPGRDPERCAIRSDRFLFGANLAGSQGALGLITEVVYEVFPVAADQALALLPVPDVATATALREQLQARFDGQDTALELFEIIRHETLRRALAHAEEHLREGMREAPYYALAVVTSEVATAPSMFGSAFVEEVVTWLMTAARDRGGALLYAQGDFDFDHAPERLLGVREACSEMSRLLPKQSYDVVVPVARLDDFVTALEAAVAAAHPELVLSVFGHGGVGALHLHAIGPDGDTVDGLRETLDTLVFDLVQAHGGSPWAEHGVGSKWAVQWQRRTPPDVQQEMLRLKRRCDPDNVLGSRLFGFDRLLAASS